MQRKKALTIAATTAIVLGAATAAGATNMGLLRSNRQAPDVGTLTVPTVPPLFGRPRRTAMTTP